MKHPLTVLLKNTIRSIDNLQEYYILQLDSVTSHINKQLPKYYNSVILELFFISKIPGINLSEVLDNDKSFFDTEMLPKIIDEILDSYEIVDEDDETWKVKYTLKHIGNLSKQNVPNPYLAIEKSLELKKQNTILNKSVLMMLLVKYEEAISGIYKFLLEKYPAAYLNEKNITYAELFSDNADISYIKQKFVDHEIESFMRQPLIEWYKTFINTHAMKFSIDSDEFKRFKEIYYRRNLVVHNQNVVNDNYLKNSGNDGVKIGDILDIDDEYIKNAFSTVLIIIYETFWRLVHTSKNEHDILVDVMFERGYIYMVKNQWEISKFIFEMLMEDDNQRASIKMCERINYWISIKNSEGMENIRNEIENLDLSAMQEKFIVAKYALLDDFQQVSVALERTINDGIMSNDIVEWPLFKQYRETEEYKVFLEKHKELFDVKGYDITNIDLEDKEDIVSVLQSVKEMLEKHKP